jgi:DNA-3-methyladenine glycosylase I
MSAHNTSGALLPGADGAPRCWWCVSSDEYTAYHDNEWGYPVTDDDRLFERLCLEAFQSGLSWLTILRKRDHFRAAFADFRIEAVSSFDQSDVERLFTDPGIVRNRRKIEAAVANARAAVRLVGARGSLARFIWSFAPSAPPAPRTRSAIPSSTADSARLAVELKRNDFRFVGPTTIYALMQACGLVNDHIVGCSTRDDVANSRSIALNNLGSGTAPESNVSQSPP